MDDFKCHAPSRQGLETLTIQLTSAAGELGLELNRDKCGQYVRTAQIDDAGDQAPFLPQIRDGYKYLGLEQLEQDSLVHFKKIEEKAQAGLR